MLTVNEKPPEFRYGIPSPLQEGWTELHQRTGLAQNQILNRLVDFILRMDQPTQAMILGMLDPTDNLVAMVLRQLEESPSQLRRAAMRAPGMKQKNRG